MIEGDIINFTETATGKMVEGRVLWAKDGKAAVITNDHLLPWQRGIIVIPVEECKEIMIKTKKELIDRVHSMSTTELEARLKSFESMKKGRR